ncbi:hypothetical protein [Nocardiopsis sp. L17-MgMaSL7]|uniref:hypothetical protein n=1 Tax=Nocardiopsis sp. L17-MgMaSL7 TaxID=1938893 RepID=UPI000D70F6FE|nr:hypothetical protein [Nocardiopsis sp. L17-MgMaSL7]PWV49402.1 hypothetical protein BDW27_109256 [Nocardiopsis sp. L17-MgMaSL7]
MTRTLTALFVSLLVLWPVPASAALPSDANATSRILSPLVVAEHLAEEPVYVHPDRYVSTESSLVLSEDRARDLNDRVTEELPGVYLAVTPWPNAPRSMGTAVVNRSEAEGTFLLVGDGLTVISVRSEGDKVPGPSSDTVRMVLAVVNQRPDLARADLGDRLDIALDLLGDEEAAAREYERMSSDGDPGGRALSLVVVLLAALPLVGLAVWALRRRALRPVRVVPLSEAVVDTVDSAAREELRRELARDLPSYGRRVAGFKGPRSRAAKALAAYEAAARVLDTAGDVSDLVGVRVLLDHCEAALTAGPSPRHCFFDPRHQGVKAPASLRVPASPRATTVPACPDCRRDVHAHVPPRAVLDSSYGLPSPYYAVPAEQSVWAATGYGTLAPDLVERVLSGGARG